MTQHNRRRIDNCWTARIWERISPYWHICTGILLAIYVGISWINGVEASQKDLIEVKQRVITLEDKSIDIAIVKQRVDDIANFIGVPRRKM